jgi:AICAR transformylase/IMP cyclohydrolase PurH
MRHQFTGNGQRFLPLRYGMNPHQSSDAELYSLQSNMPIKGWFLLCGTFFTRFFVIKFLDVFKFEYARV